MEAALETEPNLAVCLHNRTVHFRGNRLPHRGRRYSPGRGSHRHPAENSHKTHRAQNMMGKVPSQLLFISSLSTSFIYLIIFYLPPSSFPLLSTSDLTLDTMSIK